MKCSTIALVAGMALCGAAFANPKVPQRYDGPINAVEPVSVAKIRKHADGSVQLLTDWIPYSQLKGTSRGAATSRFDAYGLAEGATLDTSDGDDAPTGNTQCDPSVPVGARWWFGSAYYNPLKGEDMKLDDGAATEGGTLSRWDLIWAYTNPGGENFLAVIFPSNTAWEDADLGCNDPLESLNDGLVLNFGALPTGVWRSNVGDLDAIGIQMPADGGYVQIFAQDVSSEITLSTGPCQPMLWSTSEDYGEAGRNAGRAGVAALDDDSPTDGVLDLASECFGYDFGVCPDPLNASNGFWITGGGSGCAADFDGDGFVDFFDFDAYVACFEGGACPPGKTADFDGDGFVDFFDFDAFVAAFETGC